MRAWSKTMPTLALSTGEAELGAAARGAAEGIGVQSIMEDFKIGVALHMRSDATAAIGISKRLGLGKVRHLSVADLWIQQKVRQGLIKMGKLDGAVNPSDMMTKAISRTRTVSLMNLLGVTTPADANEDEECELAEE